MHAKLGRAFLFLDLLADYTLLSMTVMVNPCLWYVVGMKLVCPMSKFPQAPFARAPFGECRSPGKSVSRRGGRNRGGRKQMRANANKRRQTQANAEAKTQADACKREQTWTNANKRLHPPLLRFFTPPFAIPLENERENLGKISGKCLGDSFTESRNWTAPKGLRLRPVIVGPVICIFRSFAVRIFCFCAFACSRLSQTPICLGVEARDKIRVFCVFARSGPNCKMRRIQPTSVVLTGIRCKNLGGRIFFRKSGFWPLPRTAHPQTLKLRSGSQNFDKIQKIHLAGTVRLCKKIYAEDLGRWDRPTSPEPWVNTAPNIVLIFCEDIYVELGDATELFQSQCHAIGNSYLKYPWECFMKRMHKYSCVLGAPNTLGNFLFAEKHRLGEKLPNMFRCLGCRNTLGKNTLHIRDIQAPPNLRKSNGGVFGRGFFK